MLHRLSFRDRFKTRVDLKEEMTSSESVRSSWRRLWKHWLPGQRPSAMSSGVGSVEIESSFLTSVNLIYTDPSPLYLRRKVDNIWQLPTLKSSQISWSNVGLLAPGMLPIVDRSITQNSYKDDKASRRYLNYHIRRIQLKTIQELWNAVLQTGNKILEEYFKNQCQHQAGHLYLWAGAT